MKWNVLEIYSVYIYWHEYRKYIFQYCFMVANVNPIFSFIFNHFGCCRFNFVHVFSFAHGTCPYCTTNLNHAEQIISLQKENSSFKIVMPSFLTKNISMEQSKNCGISGDILIWHEETIHSVSFQPCIDVHDVTYT